MTDSMQVSPLPKARLAGLLYLVVIVTAFFAEGYVRGSLINAKDAALTAHNIMASQRLYRLGGAADLVNLACDVAIAIILYDLLKPVGPTMSMIAAVGRIVSDAILAVATFFHFSPLYLLSGAPYLNAFTQPQLQALTMVQLRIHGVGYNISLIFFAVQCLLVGWLIIRSRFLPSLIGALMVATGLAYLANSFIHLVAPEIVLPPYLLLIGFVSEASLALWLLVRGVNPAKWREAAYGSAA